ncbi:MAG: S1/P1 nuclease [Phycisphaeraceae bacterium]|nr:S1/P1 nuclease [Phycisphaeraceae bacterium]
MLKRLLVATVCLAAMLWASAAHAWGRDGHYVVAWIAYQRLEPAARAEIDRLLATEQTTLWDASYWPDEVARGLAQYRHLAPYHYINVADDAAGYDPLIASTDGDVAQGIAKFAEILGNRSEPDDKRLEALRFFAHFVGDIHQPMHVGRASDRGGNDLRVMFFNRQTNMHAVWDSGIIQRSRTDWRGFAAELNGQIRPQDADAYIEVMDPVGWANESYRLVLDEIYNEYQPDQSLAAAYVDEKLPVVEDRLSMAGVRLATKLNRMFPVDALEPEQPVKPVAE